MSTGPAGTTVTTLLPLAAPEPTAAGPASVATPEESDGAGRFEKETV
jgi:hypothetical protein